MTTSSLSKTRYSILAIMLCAGTALTPAFAQTQKTPSADEIPDDSEQVVEEYLNDLKLDRLLAAQLRQRIAEAKPEDKVKPAEALARLYVRMLSASRDLDKRRELETLSRNLLDQVPDADSSELRLDLAKATYLRAEESVERVRLKLAQPEERVEALRVLQDVLPAFSQIRARLNRRVDALEQRERGSSGDDQLLRADLAEAKRLRSIGAYYEGWAKYYIAYLNNDKTAAKEALEAFGVLLNAVPGRAPSIERFPSANLRFDHIARAVFGTAMCNAIIGNDVDAMRWLDVVLASEDLSPAAQSQVFSRQFVVLAQSSRWTDCETLIRRRRYSGKDAAVQPLTPSEARLVAVLSLDALRNGTLREGFKGTVGNLSRVALADLVAKGELAQIVDLVKQYGTLPIGDEGFIVAYVRGLQAFDTARELHKGAKPVDQTTIPSDAGGEGDGPATDPNVINAYREAANLFQVAIKADDVGEFTAEAARANLRRGLSLFYAGDLIPAADAFEKSFEKAADAQVKQDALWYAIVALDMSVELGDKPRATERDRLSTIYIQQFPGTTNATRLLIRQAQAVGVDDRRAVEILMKVPTDSPLYAAARKHAARLLYQQYRSALPNEKAFLALRFADVAEEMLRVEVPAALSGSDESAKAAAESVAIRARQLLDVLLSSQTPDLPRAEAALATLEQVAAKQGSVATNYEAEVMFRKLQIAVARNQMQDAQNLWDRLRGMQGPFAAGADQLLYRTADESWRRDQTNASYAKDVVRFGSSLLEKLPEGDVKSATRDRVAAAAALLWTSEKDKRMRELAIKYDREQITSGLRTVSSLRRLADLYESTNEFQPALDSWNEILLGMDAGSPEWYEARFNTLRLLKIISQSEARAAYTQFKLLYPTRPPEPWGSKIDELDLKELTPQELEQAAKSGSSVQPSPGSGKGGGK